MVQAVLTDGLCSACQACRFLCLARATLWYRAGQRGDRKQQMVAGCRRCRSAQSLQTRLPVNADDLSRAKRELLQAEVRLAKAKRC